MTMHSATNFAHLGNGSTSLILVSSPTVLLSLHLFEDKKLAIMFLRMTGTSFIDILQCSRTQSPASLSLHIWYTWIAEHMWPITMKLIAIFFISRYHKHPKMQAIDATLDNRSWAFQMPYPPHFFPFCFYSSLKENNFCASFGIRQQFVDSPVFNPHCRLGILWCWPSVFDFGNLTPLIWSS